MKGDHGANDFGFCFVFWHVLHFGLMYLLSAHQLLRSTLAWNNHLAFLIYKEPKEGAPCTSLVQAVVNRFTNDCMLFLAKETIEFFCSSQDYYTRIIIGNEGLQPREHKICLICFPTCKIAFVSATLHRGLKNCYNCCLCWSNQYRLV